MPKTNKYRKLTVELQILSDELRSGKVTPDEAQKVLDGILKEYNALENKQTQLERTQLVELFFPKFNVNLI